MQKRGGAEDEVIAKRKFKFKFMKHDGWENALFVHWPVDPSIVADMLPRGLEPDILEGFAWVGLVLLTERGVSAHHPLVRQIYCIDHYGANIRTYVKRNGIPGIFFWSLECSSVFASLGARVAGIPYFPATMTRTVDIEHPLVSITNGCASKHAAADPDFVFEFSSKRLGCCKSRASVEARWKLSHDEASARDDTWRERGHWFVERYSVYASWPFQRLCAGGPLILRGDVQHPPWTLQPVNLESLDARSLFQAAGFTAANVAQLGCLVGESQPHIAFSRGVGPVDFWMLEPV
jgi:uncharacterized protein YqjF (DUF2071 family)